MSDVASKKGLGKKIGLGCLIVVGAFFALALLGALVGTKDTSSSSSAPATDRGTDSPPAAELPTEAQKTAATTFYRAIFSNLKPCDAAATKTVAVIGEIQGGSSTMYDGYNAATVQVATCADSAVQLSEMDVPTALSEKGRDAAEKAKAACSNAALAKKLAAETAQEVFDGDLKPSKIAKFKERAEAAQSGIVVCAAGALGVAMASGLEGDNLPKLD